MQRLLMNRDKPNFWMKVNFQVMRNQYLEDEDERQAVNKMIYQDEFTLNKSNVAKAKSSLKANLELDACKMVLDDAFPGCMSRITKKLKLSKKMHRMTTKWTWLMWTESSCGNISTKKK